MDAPFNPLHAWLGHPLERDRLSWYGLIGVDDFETDRERIVLACDKTISTVRAHKPGANAKVWATLLDRLQTIRKTLSDASSRAQYDARLRRGDRDAWIGLKELTLPSAAAAPAKAPATRAAPQAPTSAAKPASAAPAKPAARPQPNPAPAPLPGADLLPPGVGGSEPSGALQPGAWPTNPETVPMMPAPAVAAPAGYPGYPATPAYPQAGYGQGPQYPGMAYPTAAYPGVPQAGVGNPNAPYAGAQYPGDPMSPMAATPLPGYPAPYGSPVPQAYAVPVGYPAAPAYPDPNATYGAPAAYPAPGYAPSGAGAYPQAAGAYGAPAGYGSPGYGYAQGPSVAETPAPVVSVASAVTSTAARRAAAARQASRKWQGIAVLIGVAVLGVLVVAGAYYAVNNKETIVNQIDPEKKKTPPKTPKSAQPRETSGTPTKTDPTGRDTPTDGSGKSSAAIDPPKPPSGESPNDAPRADEMATDGDPADGSMTPDPTMPDNAMPSDGMPSETGMPSVSIPAMPSTDSPAPGEPMTSTPSPPTPPPPAPIEPLSDDEKETLDKALKAAREALAKFKLQEASTALETASLLAPRSDERKGLFERLQLLSQFAGEAREALVEAMEQLPVGDEVTLAGQPMAVVETSKDLMVVRMKGQNRKFTPNDMPAGLAMALIDRVRSETDPATLLRKGAFLVVVSWTAKDPNVPRGRAKDFLNQAKLGGEDADPLLEAMDDKFKF